MKKILLLSFLTVITIVEVNAQTVAKIKPVKKISYNLGVEAGLPIQYLSDYSSVAIGASLQAEYPLFRKLGIIASGNFLKFKGKVGGKSVDFIPLMGGLKYYFKPKLYITSQAGITFYGGRDKGDGVGGSGEKYLVYTGGVGYKTSTRFDVQLKYESVYIGSSARPYSFVGARVGYNFRLK